MKYFTIVMLVIIGASCAENTKKPAPRMMEVVPDVPWEPNITRLSRDSLYDKVLGSLVGSAIGDAMGAPTEMWERRQRQIEYGYVDRLGPATISPSPEGIWDYNLPAGTTTDDTRWKVLLGTFMSKNIPSFYQNEGPDPYRFSTFIVESYQNEIEGLKETEGFDPKVYEDNFRRVAWLQEWAAVARPFSENNLEEYTTALHRFYGGELLCAGMLYAPGIGLLYAGNPHKAYKAAFRLGIFDQGYARDITGLTAAMVAAALPFTSSKDSIMAVFSAVDPNDYLRRRLFGRVAFQTYKEALYITAEAKGVDTYQPEDLILPVTDGDTLLVIRMQEAFALLDKRNQDSPAHAQEILLVSLTGMLFSDLDFSACIEFITNYGRDNDTSGAVAGAVLGAYHGFSNLPDETKNQVLKTNKNHLGIDLKMLANDLVDGILKGLNDKPG